MTAVFLEQAFWGFLGLVGALVIVIYRLYTGTIAKQLSQVEHDIKNIRQKYDNKLDILEKDLHEEIEKLRQRHIDILISMTGKK
jgi:hypothetical protein